MDEFNKWLKGAVPQFLHEGPTNGVIPLGVSNRGDLRKKLHASMAKNEFYFRIYFVLSVLLAFATILAILISMFHSLTKVSGFIPTGLGVSAVAAVTQVGKYARSKRSFDLIVVLVDHLGSDAMLREVFRVLLKQL
ncbi:MAG: hypothetical protein SFH39_11750 [Candidatus Magnetobacterium sp. LHC-1]|nr:hypothetical protein [Nitrospirota bacterium]